MNKSTVQKAGIACSQYIGVFKRGTTEKLRACGMALSISRLSQNEYQSFCLDMTNNAVSDYICKNVSVTVDEGAPIGFGTVTLKGETTVSFVLDEKNAQRVATLGTHSVTWKVDGNTVSSDTLIISKDMNWERVFRFPSANEIAAHNKKSRIRSPYIYALLKIPEGTGYTQYSVDFKADFLPKGTYCCLSCWKMDHSSLLKSCDSTYVGGGESHAYAGLQRIHDGSGIGIMSFWDVFCKKKHRSDTKLRAKRVFPKTTERSEDFGNEGTGAHCMTDYPWIAGKWYRMHLICKDDPHTGTTHVEQWLYDLEAKKRTLLCIYDTCVEDSAFTGYTIPFLENYLTEHSGEVRSLEITNARYLEKNSNQWKTVKSAYITSQAGLPHYNGSYAFGTEGQIFWMITCGVGGDMYNSPAGQKGKDYTI